MQDFYLIVTTFLTSFIFFLFLYVSCYRKFSIPHKIGMISDTRERKKVYSEYIGSYISIVHAVSVLLMGIYLLTPNGIVFVKKNSPQETFVIAFSLGYFTMDTVVGLATGFNDSVMVFHHIECLLSLIYGMVKGSYGSVIIWGLVAAELSNPFILIRKVLQQQKNYDALAEIFGIVFAVLFLFTRSYYAATVMIPLYASEVSLVIKLHGGLLWYVSLYWCNTIANLLAKHLYKMTNFWLLEELYQVLKNFRKNRNGQIFFHSCLAALCFMRTVVSWNHAEVY